MFAVRPCVLAELWGRYWLPLPVYVGIFCSKINFRRDMLHVTRFRFISLSWDSFHTATRHRLLSHPSLRPVDPHRHLVLGLVLDQRRRESGAGLARPADRVTLTTVSDQSDHWSACWPCHTDHCEWPEWPLVGLLTVLHWPLWVTSVTAVSYTHLTLPTILRV